jgi:hypothetical protein
VSTVTFPRGFETLFCFLFTQIEELLEKKPEMKPAKKSSHKHVEHLKFDDLDPAVLGESEWQCCGSALL